MIFRMRVCIYGSARDHINKEYLESGENLGKLFAEAGYDLVFGAGKTGMMGAVSRGVNGNGGKTIGITPVFMKDFEPVGDCTEIIYTEDMHQRKSTMEKRADAFVITPGGIGTYDEFFSILTQKQLKQNNKPIIILNLLGCYDHLIMALESARDNAFLNQDTLDLYEVATNEQEVMDLLKKSLCH